VLRLDILCSGRQHLSFVTFFSKNDRNYYIMQPSEVQINESLTAGIDLDMVLSEYEALEKVNDPYLSTSDFTSKKFRFVAF